MQPKKWVGMFALGLLLVAGRPRKQRDGACKPSCSGPGFVTLP